MTRNVAIGIALVGIVGAGLFLARRSPPAATKPEGGVSAFQKLSSAASITDDFVPDPADQPASVNTGSSVGTSSMVTPDAAPAVRRSGSRRFEP